MNIDRYMVNLFFEIKRNVPYHKQASLKISDPDINSVMTSLYRETKDENIKLLVRIFLEQAGEKWDNNSQKPNAFSKIINRLNKDRSTDPSSEINPLPQKSKSKRIYRGQVIED